MILLPQEQPPEGGPELTEWLTRMVILINGSLQNTQVLDPVGELPERIFEGQMVHFNQAILPNITAAGVWVVIGGVWKQMA